MIRPISIQTHLCKRGLIFFQTQLAEIVLYSMHMAARVRSLSERGLISVKRPKVLPVWAQTQPVTVSKGYFYVYTHPGRRGILQYLQRSNNVRKGLCLYTVQKLTPRVFKSTVYIRLRKGKDIANTPGEHRLAVCKKAQRSTLVYEVIKSLYVPQLCKWGLWYVHIHLGKRRVMSAHILPE
jgi:hypothetical protein